MTFLTAGACARLSRWPPARILRRSESAGALHASMGYAADKVVFVPMIGLVGRFDPQKDHATPIQAAARLGGLRPDVHFLLCGDRVDRENPELAAEIARAGIPALTSRPRHPPTVRPSVWPSPTRSARPWRPASPAW